VALFLVVATRIPNVWIDGRFWAEEGAVFFANAWNMPWWEALLATHANYLDLVANIAGLLAAHLTSLAAAPYVTATVATVIQCLPGAFLVTSRQDWLQHRFVALTALLIVVLAPVPEEVWANTANAHIHLALCAAIILGLEVPVGTGRVIYGCVLLLASLSGPGSWALLPLYATRALIDRSGPRALQGLALLAGALFQLLFFSTLQERNIGASPSVIGAIVMAKHVLVPLLGHELAVSPVGQLAHEFQVGHRPLWPLILVVSLFATAVALASVRPKHSSLWFLFAAAMLAGAGYLGAIGQKIDLIHIFAGGRYAFGPQVLIGLAILSWAVDHPGRLRVPSGVLVTWGLLLGGYNSFVPTSPIFMTGPDWRQEVARRQSNPDYQLRIWPAGWSMTLAR
jgi:hypothetical protein